MARWVHAVILWGGLAGAGLCSGASARAQADSGPHPELPLGQGVDGRVSKTVPPPSIAAQQMQRIVEEDRKKRIESDTARLLQLATELKALVDKTNKNQMSLEVLRKADEMEKLAHDLKLRMRG